MAKTKLKPGSYVWIRCEVKPGPFSDERMVRVESTIGGVWLGFANASSLKDSVTVGATSIKALVVSVQKDVLDAQPMGSGLTSTVFKEKVSKAQLVA